jgi:hypothetical protein
MGWESRRGRGRYYTRSRKVDGQVVREYVEARAERLAERERLQAEETRLAAVAAPLHELSQLLDGLTAATLIAAGYHQHHRGAWRKRRHGTQS